MSAISRLGTSMVDDAAFVIATFADGRELGALVRVIEEGEFRRLAVHDYARCRASGSCGSSPAQRYTRRRRVGAAPRRAPADTREAGRAPAARARPTPR